jgi:hypothetical protein
VVKEVVLLIEWTRPLQLVAIVDDEREEERIVTAYEPDPPMAFALAGCPYRVVRIDADLGHDSSSFISILVRAPLV